MRRRLKAMCNNELKISQSINQNKIYIAPYVHADAEALGNDTDVFVLVCLSYMTTYHDA